ncbi:DUF4240 domain-containing protein [Micromonospora sp. NPDC023966]|uniref:DUF4240 domain-containing protein n=1 Tax=Micromonospora sp. NPDC023966 TaxID=3154699 RepID=UPI003411AF23
MEQKEFWRLVESMGTEPDDDAFGRLADELATRQAWEILAFEDQLASALYALDTRDHARAARARGDWFLYVRCAAVSSGSSIYQQVLADPKELRRFARREAEPLLYVAMKAYERSTGDAWTHESPVSYESGSNVAGWGVVLSASCGPDWARVWVSASSGGFRWA